MSYEHALTLTTETIFDVVKDYDLFVFILFRIGEIQMKIIVSLLAVAVLAFSAVDAKADGPTSGFGVGFETGELIGANAFYMISPMIQIGTGLGLQIQENSNVFYLSPQARFLFNIGMAATMLTMDAQFRLLFGDSSGSALLFRLGMLHWFSKALAVYGGVNILELGFDPSSTSIGILSAYIGMSIMLGSQQ